jgi:hypothetical protein
MRARATLALGVGVLALAIPARAMAAPTISEAWVQEVKADSAQLWAKINPNGQQSTYRFEVVSQSAFEKSGYATALKVPASGKAPLGAANSPLIVNQPVGPPLTPLTPATQYRYRLTTTPEGSPSFIEHVFATQESAIHFGLTDNRGWEMVSPVDKGGGAISPPEAIFGGGDLQSAPEGSPEGAAIAYGSSTSFGDAKGAPPVDQYLSRRTQGGWVTENVSAPLASAAYGDKPDGAPYRLFSEDLSKGLLFGGLPCRGGIEGCPAPNPVLPGSGAPNGYMAYYLRGSNGSYATLLSAADLFHTAVAPAAFSVSFAAASPDLSHVVLSSCAALSANATETLKGPSECEPEAQNLYMRSEGSLVALNLLPAQSKTTPGAALAAPIGAVSANGSRVYFTAEGGLYLRDGSETKLLSAGAQFQTASSDGSVAFFTKEGHLYRYLAATKAATDLTPGGGVVGVLGASTNGSVVYYQDATAIKRWSEGTTTQVALGPGAAKEGDYPPPTGTSRVSPDGSHLAFLSTKELTPYDNGSRTELYLYGPSLGGGAAQLICASCKPTGEKASGQASIPGAPANGTTRAYRPRALAEDGLRLFFDTTDVLVPGDTNSQPDVYQWEAKGKGDCQREPGCVSLISSGRASEGGSFIDASKDGTDAYFITDESLVGADPGSIDLYDARVDGGFPEAPKPIPCIADACQALPPTPEDPDPGTLVKNAGNPAQSYVVEKAKKKKKKKHHKKKGAKKHNKGKRNGKGRAR